MIVRAWATTPVGIEPPPTHNGPIPASEPTVRANDVAVDHGTRTLTRRERSRQAITRSLPTGGPSSAGARGQTGNAGGLNDREKPPRCEGPSKPPPRPAPAFPTRLRYRPPDGHRLGPPREGGCAVSRSSGG